MINAGYILSKANPLNHIRQKNELKYANKTDIFIVKTPIYFTQIFSYSAIETRNESKSSLLTNENRKFSVEQYLLSADIERGLSAMESE